MLYDVAVATIALCAAGWTLFLLLGGRPLSFKIISAIQFGGLPGPRPRPRAKRSRLRIASSICSRSAFNSARILLTSITKTLPVDLAPAKIETTKESCFRLQYTLRFSLEFKRFTK